MKYVLIETVELADEGIECQGRAEANGVRDFWYNPHKPIMETMFPDKYGGAGTSEFSEKMSGRASSIISEMVKDE